MSRQGMRVLFTTRGSSGHVGPLAPFAHACHRAGHEVLVSAQHQFAGNVERLGLPFAPVGEPPPEEWIPLTSSFPEMDMDRAHRVMIGEFFAGIDVRAELPALTDLIESWHPDAIVRESWEFGSELLAERHEIPILRVGLGLAANELETKTLVAPSLSKMREELGLAADPEGERLTSTPYMTMMPAELEDPAAPPPEQTRRFRFEVGGDGKPLPDWWPGNQDPLVYLTFGSVAAGAHLPYYPGFYRAAIEALAPLRIRILLTVGDADREIADLGEVPSNVHVETWVPHDDVARHADLIVCHGGFGSTLGALAHGTPLVVLPLFSNDQWANAEAVARAGAGVAVADDATKRKALDLPGPATIEELARAVTSVIDEPAYRQRAAELADAIRALPPVDEAVPFIEEIASG
jgi:UDP:flavonoid glycosyltransferase YjiC (YdhE family)